MQHYFDQGVDLLDRVARALRLGPTDITRTVNDLTLEVGLVHHVELDNAERAHTRGCEVHQRRAAEPARAHAQDTRVLQPLLSRHADIGDDQVAAIPAHFLNGEVCGWFNERGQLDGHDVLLLGGPNEDNRPTLAGIPDRGGLLASALT